MSPYITLIDPIASIEVVTGCAEFHLIFFLALSGISVLFCKPLQWASLAASKLFAPATARDITFVFHN